MSRRMNREGEKERARLENKERKEVRPEKI